MFTNNENAWLGTRVMISFSFDDGIHLLDMNQWG